MSADDFTGNPEDLELYLRLLIERDGPPDRAADERDPGRRKRRDRTTKNAEQRIAELEASISTRRHPRRTRT
ncbi:hypothetical protein [Streptomyces smaragdinus]|uniref:hypothetical protein n=1 Tax=Streptomyces smaragdinus TaxID=2585196 RepID=UPI001294DB8F|nr:hypothetical protein [Streptomyces smaragdinus]